MSLKGFHIVFVTVATLLFAFLVAWSYMFAEGVSLAMSQTIRYLSIGGLLLVPFYAVYFLRKARNINL